jgi:hypothetical protein
MGQAVNCFSAQVKSRQASLSPRIELRFSKIELFVWRDFPVDMSRNAALEAMSTPANGLRVIPGPLLRRWLDIVHEFG